MNRTNFRQACLQLISVCCGMLVATIAVGQTPNYGAYFSQSAGMRGVESSNRYLYDKYFYQRPTVSPYINLARPGNDVATSYQTLVRPELQRREAAATAQMNYVQQRKLQGNVGHTVYPGAGYKPAPAVKTTPSSYHNHWYGGWANR